MAKKHEYGVGFLETTPHTSKVATINDWRKVKNARVITLNDAYYRGSYFSGTFEIADKEDPFVEGADGLRVEIKIHWYGRRLSTRWARVLIGETRPPINPKFSGKVGYNLGD